MLKKSTTNDRTRPRSAANNFVGDVLGDFCSGSIPTETQTADEKNFCDFCRDMTWDRIISWKKEIIQRFLIHTYLSYQTKKYLSKISLIGWKMVEIC